MKEIKIGIAEDQQIFRKGLIHLVNGFDGMTVVCESENGKELIDQIEKYLPHVLILDYSMPVMNGVETAKYVHDKYPNIKIILLSMYDNEELIENAIKNGANGYLSKDDDLNELENAIKGVLLNNYYMNDRLSSVFLNGLLQKDIVKPIFHTEKVEFDEDEIKTLKLMSQGLTTNEISERLFKSPRTIEKYRTEMLHKTGTMNGIGLMMYVIKNKIIEL